MLLLFIFLTVCFCIILDPSKRDLEWSSSKTVSLEQDVSKVLQETVPATRSLGAIPKRLRSSTSHSNESEDKSSRAVMKYDLEKNHRKKHGHCGEERSSGRKRAVKESKITQTIRQNDNNSVEGLECLVSNDSLQRLVLLFLFYIFSLLFI